MVYIILLNWNGSEDTIDCIKSIVSSSYKNFKVVIIDNGSEDNSVENINNFVFENDFQDCVKLLEQNENLGFAKGCNVGIDYAVQQDDCDFIWLLNNDTVITKDCISNLVSFMQENLIYKIITPRINYFDNKNLIWNCGGKISRLGFRKYYYADQNEKEIPSQKYFDITFVTNCASFFRKNFFENRRLNERFFFGEEDFSLCLRSLREKVKIACLLDTVIYHKLSSSINNYSKNNNDNKLFIHYANRFIDMRLFYNNNFIFFLYKLFYMPYIKLLIKNNITNKKVFYKDLKYIINNFDSVNKEFFESVMKNGYHFFTTSLKK